MVAGSYRQVVLFCGVEFEAEYLVANDDGKSWPAPIGRVVDLYCIA